MQLIEAAYVVISGVFLLTGLTLIGMGTKAYSETHRPAMVHLTIGFCLVVAAVAATMVSAFLTDFQAVRSLLLVQNGMSTLGLLFVVYSLITYT